MSTYILTAAAFLLLALNGCKDDSTSVLSPPEPTEFRNSLIPFAVGNRWTYIDSLFTDSPVAVETYSMSVVGFRRENGLVWWQLSDSRIPSTVIEYAVRNDSILNLQYNFQNPVESLEYIPAHAADTVQFLSMIGGDVMVSKYVYALNPGVIVPAGTFSGCIAVEMRGGYQEILKPRLGLIQREVWYEQAHRKIVLAGYELKR